MENKGLDGATAPQTVFLVHRSNCEPWEDYNAWVDSVWSTRELAVRHIEDDIGMEREQGEFAGDRWVREYFMRCTREDFDSDEDWEFELAANGGEPPILYSEKMDAWIEEMGVDVKVGEP